MEKTKARLELERQLILLLTKAQAHITFDDSVKGIKFENLGKTASGLPYTIWQLAEHLRIAQYDILDFSRNTGYREMNWPEDYWPKAACPTNKSQWEQCIEAVQKNRAEFIELLQNAEDIWKPFPHGTGQNLVREAMLIADHNSYHTGQIILLRRLLGDY